MCKRGQVPFEVRSGFWALELELQAVVSCLMWVLVAEFPHSGREPSALTTEPSL